MSKRKSQYSSTEKYLKNYFRQVWGWSDERNTALKRAFAGRINGIEHYGCESCSKVISRPEKEVDHISPVIPLIGMTRRENNRIDWNDHYDRLFCAPEELQILCKDCHKAKTHTTEAPTRAENRKKSK